MTETERWVHGACEWIVESGHPWLYRDLYKDLRESLPCVDACRLIEAGLRRTRFWAAGRPPDRPPSVTIPRARAVAALHRLARYAEMQPIEMMERAAAVLRRLASWDILRQAKVDGLSTEETLGRLADLEQE